MVLGGGQSFQQGRHGKITAICDWNVKGDVVETLISYLIKYKNFNDMLRVPVPYNKQKAEKESQTHTHKANQEVS